MFASSSFGGVTLDIRLINEDVFDLDFAGVRLNWCCCCFEYLGLGLDSREVIFIDVRLSRLVPTPFRWDDMLSGRILKQMEDVLLTMKIQTYNATPKLQKTIFDHLSNHVNIGKRETNSTWLSSRIQATVS